MISIIVPVYQSEKTLERCIRSICGQSYSDLEILIVVDGPDDASSVLAESLAKEDDRIRLIYQDNQGVSAARNAGIREAQGCYVQFVDSDDYLEPSACAHMLHTMEMFASDLVICGFHHWYFGSKTVKLPDIEGVYQTESSAEVFLYLYETQFMNMLWNKLYKRELIKEGFVQNRNLGEDLLFNLQYLHRAGSFCVSREAVCNYIQDDRGTTLSTGIRRDRIETALYLYEETKYFCEETFSKKGDEKQVLKGKVAVEFMDALESLAFETRKDKKTDVIAAYQKAWKALSYEGVPQFRKLDYQIIYAFFARGSKKFTYFLIWFRGIIVRLYRKMRCL